MRYVVSLALLVAISLLSAPQMWAGTPIVLNPDNGHRYQMFDQTMTWHDASAYCESMGGYLATVTSQTEDDFVYDNLAFYSPNQMVWLGATDEELEGVWEWETGEVWDYTNWAAGEPNDCSGIEHYLVVFTPHDHGGRPSLWNDLGVGFDGGCGCWGCIDEWYPMSFICEWDFEVNIDIKPGSDPNCFNINGHGVVPVAILGSEDLDVTKIDFESLLFAGLEVRVRGNRGPLCSYEYSNDDAFLDLVCHFEDDAIAWEPGDADACVTGALLPEFGGIPVEGCDSICIVP